MIDVILKSSQHQFGRYLETFREHQMNDRQQITENTEQKIEDG
jgi:hypothetical protein